MVLSFSRDPFACFTTSMDAATFWDCHRRAFDHFGGVPGTIVYDRTKTIVKRHVAPGKAVPLHPEAVAFAEHYGFVIDVLAARRPTGKGRVERQVTIVRDHVLAGRSFTSLAAGRCRVPGLGADPPPAGAPHHRTPDRHPGRRRRRRAAPDPGRALRGHRHASAPGRQGLPGVLRGQPLLGARTAGPRRATGRGPAHRQRGDHPRPRRRRRVSWLATHPRRVRAGHLGDRPDPLGRAARRAHPGHHHRPRRSGAGPATPRRLAAAGGGPARRAGVEHPGRGPPAGRLRHRRRDGSALDERADHHPDPRQPPSGSA